MIVPETDHFVWTLLLGQTIQECTFFTNGELKTVAAAVPPKAKSLTHHFHLFRRLDKAFALR